MMQLYSKLTKQNTMVLFSLRKKKCNLHYTCITYIYIGNNKQQKHLESFDFIYFFVFRIIHNIAVFPQMCSFSTFSVSQKVEAAYDVTMVWLKPCTLYLGPYLLLVFLFFWPLCCCKVSVLMFLGLDE